MLIIIKAPIVSAYSRACILESLWTPAPQEPFKGAVFFFAEALIPGPSVISKASSLAVMLLYSALTCTVQGSGFRI